MEGWKGSNFRNSDGSDSKSRAGARNLFRFGSEIDEILENLGGPQGSIIKLLHPLPARDEWGEDRGANHFCRLARTLRASVARGALGFRAKARSRVRRLSSLAFSWL